MEKKVQPRFPATGTHLQRYASVFSCVEINSSFYRPHKPETYRRWADSVPGPFRFSAKVPKQITHILRLRESQRHLDDFLSQVTQLGSKLGPLLIQLPPSERFHHGVAAAFLKQFRECFSGLIALEPRHLTWFDRDAIALLEEHRVARVAADPAAVPAAAEPAGWPGLVYRRLHGSPKTYYSEYGEKRLAVFAEAIVREKGNEKGRGESYCIFDNTAEGYAIPDAMALGARLARLTEAC